MRRLFSRFHDSLRPRKRLAISPSVRLLGLERRGGGRGEGTCSFIREQLTGLRVANLHSPLFLPLPSLDRYGISWPTEKFQPSVRVSFSRHDELPLVNAIFLAGDARLANGYVCRVRTFKMRARSVTKLGLVDVQECFQLLPKEGMGSELRSSKVFPRWFSIAIII